MNLNKDNQDTIIIKKRKSLQIEKQGEFIHLALSHYELDNLGKISKLLQNVEITLTESEAREIVISLTNSISLPVTPF